MAHKSFQSRSRGEIQESVEKTRSEYEEGNERLDQDAQDVETVRDLLDELELDGTAESAEATQRSVEAADHSAAEQFREDADTLSERRAQGEELERDLRERSELTGQDVQKIRDGQEKVRAGEAREHLGEAQTELAEVQEFIAEQEREAQEARQRSEADYQRDLQRVRSGGR